MAFSKENRRLRIKRSIRRKISGSAERPRLSIFRSNKGIYAQVIDDGKAITIVSASSKELTEIKGFTVEVAKQVGKLLAEKATANGVKQVVFDRNGYLYHGKIKALAEGAREGGLEF
jgi:large subunit ribosomal protein L18